MSLSKGGAERSSSITSKLLASNNYDVTIVSIIDNIDFDYGGQYISLENQKNKESFFFYRKYSKFKRAKSIFKKNNFDIIIDARTRPIFIREFLIQKIIYKKTPIIYVIHNYFLKDYFNNVFFSKLLYKNKQIVTVSEEITKRIKAEIKEIVIYLRNIFYTMVEFITNLKI